MFLKDIFIKPKTKNNTIIKYLGFINSFFGQKIKHLFLIYLLIYYMR